MENTVSLNEPNPPMTDKEQAEFLLKAMVKLNHYITELCQILPDRLNRDIEFMEKIKGYFFSGEVFDILNNNQKLKLFQVMQGNLDFSFKHLLNLQESMLNSVNQLGVIKGLKNEIENLASQEKDDIIAKMSEDEKEFAKKVILEKIHKYYLKKKKKEKEAKKENE